MARIIALSGSPTSGSINHRLLLHAIDALGEAVEITRVGDLNLPLYSGDLEASDGVPAAAKALADALEASDGLILASPEYNGGMPAALKNAIDWVSRASGQGFFKQNKVLLLGTSPGGRGAKGNQEHLAALIPWWGGEVVASYSLPSFHDNFADGKVASGEHADRLAEELAAFKAALG